MKTPHLLILSLAIVISAHAGSATWNLNPTSGDWNTATNWTPATVPNGPSDVATFGVSNLTGISLSNPVEADSIVFNPGASAFTINDNRFPTTISGQGIVNNSGVTQNFVLSGGLGDVLTFSDGATAGDGTVFQVASGAGVSFEGRSSAGSATFTNSEAIAFNDQSNAAQATFINNASSETSSSPGSVYFYYPGPSGARRATFINNGGASPGTFGGGTLLYSSGGMGDSIVICNGATAPDALGGGFEIGNAGRIEHATLIANGGANGGDGGSLFFFTAGETGAPRIQVFGNGYLDISGQGGGRVVAGSLEGDGLVFLGGSKLEVGASNRNTIFSGLIQDGGLFGGTGGSLRKSGSQAFTLKGANTYTGRTVVNAGQLLLINASGSTTGTGPVQVNAGTLGGQATITGAITIGTGTGVEAILAPGKGSNRIGSLTTENTLTFNSDGTYSCLLNSDATAASQATANGVTITSGAQFSATDIGEIALPAGTIFTVISNVAATPIAGTFGNLPDGSTLLIGSNTFQASYSGGDGNDLTLTVVP
jgi:autotransporter-associated beta strand protein